MKNFIFHSLSNIIDPPLHLSVDPMHVFKGNLAPVEEMEPTNCQVIEGQLPLSLNGVYIRNGPNPQFQARRALHLFEGDGMLHSLRLSNGLATYCNRYVKTHKYMLERDAGFPAIPNMLSGFYGLLDVLRFLMVMKRIITGQLGIKHGIGVANTSLALISERWDFDKKLLYNMTAHPKVDMDTKETFAFSWSFAFPHLTFFRIDEKGVKHKEVPIFSMRRPSIIHDFAITKRFAIFHETQLIFSLAKMLMGRGAPLVYERDKSTRIGVISRYAKCDSVIKWFEVPRFNVAHIINAWENGVLDEIPKTTGLVKIDLETRNEVGKRFYGPGCFGGEPLFVRRNSAEDVVCDEDEGYVMTYVHNEHTDESVFLLMDAKSPEFTTIAAIKLPRRVPYGFHGLFLTN
ncbi:Nine-cis-epoxycarotenoid dioxygenase 4 [Theobroma cacao]|uniref:Nine-cis-epoxycarotenoid dioxygenase 4 n=1 Tax=Theobroma cacao TaxID=3641 RepID=A0A061GTU5_THECC|nr:Nine-cis-epoxycarotenoid dioxygenase 4 [Theobroma cacao]